MLDVEVPMGRKLFEATDKPTESKIMSENKEEWVVERESTWTGEVKGYNPFPSWRVAGSGRSFTHDNGITISHWQGGFRTEKKQQLTFKGRDVNKNGKFVVLRTYFTESETLAWMNGLVCILSGQFESSAGVSKGTGYELILTHYRRKNHDGVMSQCCHQQTLY
jgi:hypothetical protein